MFNFRDRCIVVAIRYESQDANLYCSVNRKPIQYDFHTITKPIRYCVNIIKFRGII